MPRTLADAIAEGQATYHADRAFRVCVNPSTGAHDALCIRSRVPSNLTLLGHVVLRSEDNAWQDAPGNPSRLMPDTPPAPPPPLAAQASPRPARSAERTGQALSPAEERVARLAARGCTFEAVLVATGYKRQALINLCCRLRGKLGVPAPAGHVPHDRPGSGWSLLCEALHDFAADGDGDGAP